MEELEWPDHLEEETGIFRYYGDNREPGRLLTDTKKKGNLVLEKIFALLNEGTHLEDIPPFFKVKNRLCTRGKVLFTTKWSRGPRDVTSHFQDKI